ncbi:MAG: serine/threonine protein kinase [Thermoanaerobaculia bacterium]|nr:serine/threonine protein kinase [Thermoanaerobaculia bacterium]
MADDERPYLVMEYVEGTPIDRACDRRNLGLPERIQLFLQVCDAVQYAHRNLVVHRDLKPSNVLVTDDGDVRLLDFGIAKALAEEPNSETAGLTVQVGRRLTPRYASPEQLRGEPIGIGSDVYSLGVVLYELLCGRSPYELDGTAAHDIERAICETPASRPIAALDRVQSTVAETAGPEPPTVQEISARRALSPGRLRRLLAGDLETILLMALRKEPERRYPSVKALADDLRRYLDGRPVAARPDTLGYRVTRFVGRHRVAVMNGALMLALLIAATVTSIGLYLRVRAALGEAQLQRTHAEQVGGFLDQILSQVDPVVTQSREDVRVRDVPDEASRRLASALDQQSEVSATLHTTIGNAYRNLALYDDAKEHLTAVLTLRRAAVDDVALAAALVELGGLHTVAGELDAHRAVA